MTSKRKARPQSATGEMGPKVASKQGKGGGIAKHRLANTGRVREESIRGSSTPNGLRNAIEKGIGSLFQIFVARLTSIPIGKVTTSPIEKLYYALRIKEVDDESPFEDSQKQEVMNAIDEFCRISAIVGFAVSRGSIHTKKGAKALTIEYLLAIPEWDTSRMDAMGTTDEFHAAIYWDSQTWPEVRVISAGLDDAEEGLQRVGGVKVYN